jgi:ABC-type Fe3+/spermidine/putrescine transport system ATPase subunit
MHVLELRSVSKSYPGHTAVDRVSLSVEHGAFFSLVGPSGCGKTTTLRMVAGFEQPTEGDVLLNGTRINHLRPYERNVTTVFQSYALFPHLTVRDNIEFGLKRHRVRETASKIRDVMDLVQLTGKESRHPAQLSGGERQRVALARALVLAPDMLLLDEPLSALDPTLRRQVRSELKALQRRTGITFLFVTHDQEEALSMSDRIAIMNHGRVEQEGPPQELYRRPATRFVAGFLGAVNWVGDIGIRPEAIRISRGSLPTDARPATVEATSFLGNCVHVETRLRTGERIVSELPAAEADFRHGDPVHVWWRSTDELRLS